MHLALRNEGNVPTRIRMVNVLLRWKGREIAQGKVESLPMVLDPGGITPFSLQVISELEEQKIPEVAEGHADPWVVRAYLLMRHAIRDEPITLYMQRPLQ